MAWNKKKLKLKLAAFFEQKKVRYTLDDEKDKIQFELNLLEREITIYPYLLIQEDLICLHVNLTKINPKSFDYKKLNDFNEQSSFFITFVTSGGIVVLEYCWYVSEHITDILELLLSQLTLFQNEIDCLE